MTLTEAFFGIIRSSVHPIRRTRKDGRRTPRRDPSRSRTDQRRVHERDPQNPSNRTRTQRNPKRRRPHQPNQRRSRFREDPNLRPRPKVRHRRSARNRSNQRDRMLPKPQVRWDPHHAGITSARCGRALAILRFNNHDGPADR